MHIRSDFSQRVVVTPDAYAWVASPQAGVERVMLDRMGQESGHATSIVRYAPGSRFPAHHHPGGEEILVLSGTFSEGDRHHGPGSYVRNPPGSQHQPASVDGAVLFVKLCQMRPSEAHPVCIDTQDAARWSNPGSPASCPLFDDGVEHVTLERLPAQAWALPRNTEGAEFLVLAGQLQEGAQVYDTGTWIRLPPGDGLALRAGSSGATVYLKTGHLAALSAVSPLR